jgi:hypothetical protein
MLSESVTELSPSPVGDTPSEEIFNLDLSGDPWESCWFINPNRPVNATMHCRTSYINRIDNRGRVYI